MTSINTTLSSLLESLGIADFEINLIGNVTPEEKASLCNPGSPIEAELTNIEADKWQDTVPVKGMSHLIAALHDICNDPRYRGKVEKMLIAQAESDREESEIDRYERNEA